MQGNQLELIDIVSQHNETAQNLVNKKEAINMVSRKGHIVTDETKRKISIAKSKPKIMLVCKICGNSYFVIPSRKNKSKYCSWDCMIMGNFTSRPTWNKGTKGLTIPWNKGRKFPEFSGKNHHNWKGGEYNSSDGYVFVYSPNHPNKNKDGYILKHRLVMEKNLGRYLEKKEVVHHMDMNTSNNDIKNLMLFNNDKEHRRYHYLKRKGIPVITETVYNNGKHYARYHL